jgi:hypothetical protein
MTAAPFGEMLLPFDYNVYYETGQPREGYDDGLVTTGQRRREGRPAEHVVTSRRPGRSTQEMQIGAHEATNPTSAKAVTRRIEPNPASARPFVNPPSLCTTGQADEDATP